MRLFVGNLPHSYSEDDGMVIKCPYCSGKNPTQSISFLPDMIKSKESILGAESINGEKTFRCSKCGRVFKVPFIVKEQRLKSVAKADSEGTQDPHAVKGFPLNGLDTADIVIVKPTDRHHKGIVKLKPEYRKDKES